jgi:hypothetical protein
MSQGDSIETCANNIAPLLKDKGFEPGTYQFIWRDCGSPNEDLEYNSYDVMLAILDALIHQDGVAAWSGDGTSCVQQMIEFAYRRRDVWRARAINAENKVSGMQTEVDMWKSNYFSMKNRFAKLNMIEMCLCSFGDKENRDFVKAITTNNGTVYVCERCSRHWFSEKIKND